MDTNEFGHPYSRRLIVVDRELSQLDGWLRRCANAQIPVFDLGPLPWASPSRPSPAVTREAIILQPRHEHVFGRLQYEMHLHTIATAEGWDHIIYVDEGESLEKSRLCVHVEEPDRPVWRCVLGEAPWTER